MILPVVGLQYSHISNCISQANELSSSIPFFTAFAKSIREERRSTTFSILLPYLCNTQQTFYSLSMGNTRGSRNCIIKSKIKACIHRLQLSSNPCIDYPLNVGHQLPPQKSRYVNPLLLQYENWLRGMGWWRGVRKFAKLIAFFFKRSKHSSAYRFGYFLFVGSQVQSVR